MDSQVKGVFVCDLCGGSTSAMYNSIEKAMLALFNGDIPLEDPYESTTLFVEEINKHIIEEVFKEVIIAEEKEVL